MSRLLFISLHDPGGAGLALTAALSACPFVSHSAHFAARWFVRFDPRRARVGWLLFSSFVGKAGMEMRMRKELVVGVSEQVGEGVAASARLVEACAARSRRSVHSLFAFGSPCSCLRD